MLIDTRYKEIPKEEHLVLIQRTFSIEKKAKKELY